MVVNSYSKERKMLKFSPANTKLKKLHDNYRLRSYNKKTGKQIYSFDILSGVSCPGANECFSKVIIEDGIKKIKDGKDMKFRCFSASQEVLLPKLYNLRKNNFDVIRSLKTESDITEELLKYFPSKKNIGILRFHVGGDIFKEEQLLAYFNLAREFPKTRFYAYTKSLRIYTRNMDKMPENMKIVASKGGRYDSYIEEYNLPFSQVVYCKNEAKKLGLPIDYDDSHCVFGKSSALLIHGQGPKNSLQSKIHTAKFKKKGVVNISGLSLSQT